jgi:hypothetical protein
VYAAAAVSLQLQFPAPVGGMCRNPDGTSEDDDNQDVQYALETLQSLRERQRGLEAELAVVLHAHQQHLQHLQQQQQHLQYNQLALQQHGRAAASVAAWEDAAASSCYGESEYSSVLGAGLAGRGANVYADIKEASVAMVLALAGAGAAGERLQQQLQLRGVHASASTSSLAMFAAAGTASRSGSGVAAGSCSSLPSLLRNQSGGSTFMQQQQLGADGLVLVSERQTIIWWAQEQLQGALDAIAASRTVLQLLRNEAGLLKVRQRDSMGVSLTVDTIDWALSKGNTVIVQGELQVRTACCGQGASGRFLLVLQHLRSMVLTECGLQMLQLAFGSSLRTAALPAWCIGCMHSCDCVHIDCTTLLALALLHICK